MRQLIITVVAGALLAHGAYAQQPAASGGAMTAAVPGGRAAASTVDVTATVAAVDKANRKVTLVGPEGRKVTIAVGPEVRNFDQVQVGDTVSARYSQAIAVELRKSDGSAPTRTEQQAMTRAKPGEKPGGAVVREVRMVADVTALDAKQQSVTLRGPQGNEVDVRVEDPARFAAVKVGDHVEVTYLEALAISVQPGAKAPAKK
jgi:hypothetical protein